MKKLILAFFLLVAAGMMGFAQCGKKIVFVSSKTEYLDAAGTVQQSVDEKTTIEITKPEISITPGENKMTGTIKSDTCNWKIPFKEGKSVIKATIIDPNGDSKNVTLTIEGKDGKIILLAEIEGTSDRIIRVTADKFEEKK